MITTKAKLYISITATTIFTICKVVKYRCLTPKYFDTKKKQQAYWPHCLGELKTENDIMLINVHNYMYLVQGGKDPRQPFFNDLSVSQFAQVYPCVSHLSVP